MKHSSMDSTPDMPEHLLFDILLWLPITSLLRFKSVCKSWFTLIDSPIFISQHFDHNSGNANLLCVYRDTARDTVSDGCQKFCLLSGKKYEVHSNFDCGLPSLVVDGRGLTFSSNGIICFVRDRMKISLWNPAMKQLRSLSVPCQFLSFFGFGFNVKSNDHIIVRTTPCDPNTSHALVDVYSLRADSWRTMLKDIVIPSRFYQSFTYHITKDGTCFWIACYTSGNGGDGGDDGDVILSFDLNEETYETMSLPVRKVPFAAVIDFLGDKLAYIHSVDDCASNYEIWVLHEYGVRESWNKAWKIGPTFGPWNNGSLFPSRFISNGEFLLLNNLWFRKNSGVFWLYNLSTEENEYLELLQPNFSLLWSVSYTESLFPVKKVNDAQ